MDYKKCIFMELPRVNELKNSMNSWSLLEPVGHNNISPHYLRIASDILAPVFMLLYRLCF